MILQKYRKQVSLLLKILPEVSKSTSFALHGGTAINLFIRDMPRLSVDIDLTYLNLEDRDQALQSITTGLREMALQIQKSFPLANLKIIPDASKIFVNHLGSMVKIEVNQINRGTLMPPEKKILCDKAQESFDAFCEMNVVEFGQLFGGKICAALDRQHPRDLFDVKYFLEEIEFTKNLKEGILLALLSSRRPFPELLQPNWIDQRQTLIKQFAGMTNEPFDYQMMQETRRKLLEALLKSFTKEDKEFILSIHRLQPNWDYFNLSEFPSIIWKVQNLKILKEENPVKFDSQYRELEELFI